MNTFRQKIIAHLADNSIYLNRSEKTRNKETEKPKEECILINSSLLDGSITLFNTKKSLWQNYEEIANDPLPYMIFLLKLIEWKKSLENT